MSGYKILGAKNFAIGEQLTRLLIQEHAAELEVGKALHSAIEEAIKRGDSFRVFQDEIQIIPREELFPPFTREQLEQHAAQVEANWLASLKEMPERFSWDIGASGCDVTAFAKMVFGKDGVYQVESFGVRGRGNRAERRKASHKARHPHKREREAPRKTPEIRAWKRSAEDE